MAAGPGRRTDRTATGAASVWLRRPGAGAGAEGRAQALTLDKIVAAAVTALDEEGADRLTMRRLADRLGVASGTLYLHVRTRDDVLDLALDAIFGQVSVPEEPGSGWREAVTALIVEWRATMLRHPWSVAVLGRPMLGPNVLARTEFLYAALARAGLTGVPLTSAAYALANYVIGSATMQMSGPGRSEEEDRREADEYLRAQRDRYPTLARQGAPMGHDWDAVFTEGLAYLLDGIEARAVSPGR